ncbi:MAG: HEAT repeat domain-containing protein [Pseudomonadota bacterium]
MLLELPRVGELRCFINGVEQVVPEVMSHAKEPRLVAPFLSLDLPERDRREVLIELHLPADDEKAVLGHVRLHRRINPEPPYVRQQNDEILIRQGEFSTRYSLENIDHQSKPEPVKLPRGEPYASVSARWLDAVSAKSTNEPADIDQPKNATMKLDRYLSFAGTNSNRELQELIDALNDPDGLAQLAAICSLSECRREDAAPALRSKLATEIKNNRSKSYGQGLGVRMREMCILGLDKLADRDAAPLIADCLHDDEFYGVRRLAADALGRLGDSSHVKKLQEWKNDFDPETASAAMRQAELLSQT